LLPDSFAAVVEQALPARSVAVADGVQVILDGFALLVAPDAVPSVTVMLDPLSVIVEPVKVTVAVTWAVLPRLTVPRGSCVVFAAFQISTLSFPAPPLTRRRVIVVAPPVQLARIESASTVSLKVNVIVSPASAWPAVPPATFVVCTSTAAGAVLSTVMLKPFWEAPLPAMSAAVIEKE
jgi:hypothetical protein